MKICDSRKSRFQAFISDVILSVGSKRCSRNEVGPSEYLRTYGMKPEWNFNPFKRNFEGWRMNYPTMWYAL